MSVAAHPRGDKPQTNPILFRETYQNHKITRNTKKKKHVSHTQEKRWLLKADPKNEPWLELAGKELKSGLKEIRVNICPKQTDRNLHREKNQMKIIELKNMLLERTTSLNVHREL